MDSLFNCINNNFEKLFKEKNEEAEKLLKEIKVELEGIKDGSAFLLKTGGTIDGDLEISGKLSEKNRI